MSPNKPSNVREFVWKIIETDVAVRKDISRGVINIRALAKYIIEEYKLKISIDAIISAIRRYNAQPVKKIETAQVYGILKQAKITSVTKIASFTLKKNEEVHRIISRILPEGNYAMGEILRVIEGAKIFKLIFDQKNFDKMQETFGRHNIVDSYKKLGMLEMIYPSLLVKIPGVFSVISNELAQNDISIIDALICNNEHIIVINEKDLLKAFDIVFNLCN